MSILAMASGSSMFYNTETALVRVVNDLLHAFAHADVSLLPFFWTSLKHPIPLTK